MGTETKGKESGNRKVGGLDDLQRILRHALHNIVQGPPGQRMADFWHQHLSSEWPMLDLPWRHQQSLVTQAPQDATETAYAGASIGFALSKSLTDRLRTFALHYQLDLPAICLTALQALFLRYTGQSDFVIGVAMSGRVMPKSADLFGYLSNIVMIRNLFTASDTALTAIQNTAQFMRRAQLSQSYPYPLLDQQLRKKIK
ncbi:hypothetical protein C2W62_16495 [Candidatus Entotheonella serta]|nr:hypothetical protein C2W62_16495 [Candidatus Entotheonella serta]